MRHTTKLITLFIFLSVNVFSQKPSGTPEMLDKVLSGVVTVAVYETDVAMKPMGFRGSPSDIAYSKALDLSSSKSSGSGFIIQQNGKYYIITNAHVVQSASNTDGSIYVYTIGNKKYEAKIKGGDTFYDIAVLEFVLPPGSEISTLKFKTAEPRIGEPVFAIGNPLGDYPYTVTDGIISAKNRVRSGIGGIFGKFGFIQSTATVIWGNSGGPLVDANGDVAGINSQIAFAQSGNTSVWQPQINFALQADIAQRLINDILTNDGLIKRAYIGVEISRDVVDDSKAQYLLGYNNGPEVNPTPVISGFIPGSPAEAALGKYKGYTVLAVNNEEVKNIQDILGIFEKTAPGQSLTFKLSNGGLTATVKLTTQTAEASENANIGDYALSLWGCRPVTQEGGLTLNFFDRKIYSSYQKTATEDILNLGQKNNLTSDVLFNSEWLVVGAGLLAGQNSQIWTVKDVTDLGTALRLCGTNGVVDLVLFRKGTNPSDDNNYISKRFVLSGRDYVYKQTLWY